VAGKVLEAWPVEGEFVPLESRQGKRGPFPVLDPDSGMQLGCAVENQASVPPKKMLFCASWVAVVKQRESWCMCGQRVPCLQSGSDPGSLEPVLHFGKGEPASKPCSTSK